MPSVALRNVSLPLYALVFGLGASSHATAQQAAAPDDRCSGTLCDLYYGGAAPEPQPGAKQAAPKPIMVPQGGGIMGFFSSSSAAQQSGAPAKRPLVGVGGGGIAAMARGEAPERCSGTLCDFYYGGPPPEKPAPQAAQPTAADQQAAVPSTPEDDVAPTQSGVRYRPLPAEKPVCAPKAHDPWGCYR